MKPQTKKIKFTLADAGFDSALFLGLVSSEADYKISLLLNRVLTIKLSSDKPVIFVNHSGNKVCFSRFTSVSELNDLSYQLVSNKSNGSIFSKKYPNIDYLLILSDSISKETEDRIVSGLRGTKEITAVFLLEPESHISNNIVLQIL